MLGTLLARPLILQIYKGTLTPPVATKPHPRVLLQVTHTLLHTHRQLNRPDYSILDDSNMS